MFFIYAMIRWIVMPFDESEQIGREEVWGPQQIKHSVLDLDKFKISTRPPVEMPSSKSNSNSGSRISSCLRTF